MQVDYRVRVRYLTIVKNLNSAHSRNKIPSLIRIPVRLDFSNTKKKQLVEKEEMQKKQT